MLCVIGKVRKVLFRFTRALHLSSTFLLPCASLSEERLHLHHKHTCDEGLIKLFVERKKKLEAVFEF